HQRLAWEMLQHAVIGTESMDTNHWCCFKKGFYMQCANTVTVPEIARSFLGGIEEFISSAQNSTINSFYDLRLRVICRLGIESMDRFAAACAEADGGFAGKIFEEIFKEFLTEVGSPCPQLLDTQKHQFSSEVKLTGIQSPTFRLRLLCWSVTGAPWVIDEGEPIRVFLVEDDDSTYLPISVEEGVPTYNPDAEPKNARTAIHHWLLTQMLESIGSYTTI
ncbi:hypothetical protein F5051DRAFT_341650, partial [Lentinula edodes]